MPTCIFKLSAAKTMRLLSGHILPRNTTRSLGSEAVGRWK